MKIGVKILPRNEVLDSQGRAVEKTLSQHGKTVDACRVGKYVQLDIEASNEEQALNKAREIAEFVLYNPLIETFELEVVS
ncbi:MAG: phosphoribosylformylglycinamidine synthase subunit PurS [Bdellovibrionaceae bacterium]|nr:phosphoribosylformylglycinamidine synthase subunit PurS [Bdellovibrionales bacterium]MCB9083902.1 phosphoribosylformylglycinamidine synthase subunit PurS [Pseudobdellovibrionaceae bacterium]